MAKISSGFQWLENDNGEPVGVRNAGSNDSNEFYVFPRTAVAFTTRALKRTDNAGTFIISGSETATVNAGMPGGFGASFKGTAAFTAGSGVTVNDVRTTGATNPWCALVQTAANTYDVVGTKA